MGGEEGRACELRSRGPQPAQKQAFGELLLHAQPVLVSSCSLQIERGTHLLSTWT